MKRTLATLLVVVSACLAAASAVSASPADGRANRNPLTGTWSGTYGGAFHGTFTLHWKQSGSQLSGTINLVNQDPGCEVSRLRRKLRTPQCLANS